MWSAKSKAVVGENGKMKTCFWKMGSSILAKCSSLIYPLRYEMWRSQWTTPVWLVTFVWAMEWLPWTKTPFGRRMRCSEKEFLAIQISGCLAKSWNRVTTSEQFVGYFISWNSHSKWFDRRKFSSRWWSVEKPKKYELRRQRYRCDHVQSSLICASHHPQR